MSDEFKKIEYKIIVNEDSEKEFLLLKLLGEINLDYEISEVGVKLV